MNLRPIFCMEDFIFYSSLESFTYSMIMNREIETIQMSGGSRVAGNFNLEKLVVNFMIVCCTFTLELNVFSFLEIRSKAPTHNFH